MDARERTKALVESALLAIIAVIFAIAGIYIPFLSFLMIFIPVPFIVAAVRHDLKHTLLAVTAASLIIGSLSSPVVGLYIALISGINSSVMGLMIKRGKSVRSILIAGSAASLAATLLTFAVSTVLMGVNTLVEMETLFTEIVEYQKRFLGGMDGQGSVEMIRSLELMKSTLLTLIPSSLIAGSVGSTCINYLLTGAILKRTGFAMEPLGPFSRFSLPKNIMMGLLVIIALSYGVTRLNLVDGQTLFLNVFYLFQMAFLIQGLAVLVFFMDRFRLPKWIRGLLVVLFLFLPTFSIMAAILGIADSLFNFRRLESR